MKRLSKPLLFTALIALSACHAHTKAHNHDDHHGAVSEKSQVGALPKTIASWSKAVSTMDVQVITDHYAKDGVLKGTVWNGFVGMEPDKEGRVISDYFVALLDGKKDVRVAWHKIDKIKPGVYAVDYEFLWNDAKTGKAGSLLADATYVVKNGKIKLHHSSPK